MDNRAYAIVTGIFVIVLGAALVLGAIWLKGPAVATRPYIVVSDGSVYGLMPQSTVFFRGIAAGKVVSLGFSPEDTRDILIHIELKRGVPVTQSTVAKLNLQGLTGMSQLELENTAADSPLLTTSTQSPARIPLEPSFVDKLSKNGEQVIGQLDILIGRLNKILAKGSQTHIKELLANADAASAELVILERHLDRVATLMPSAVKKSKATMDHINRLLTSLDTLTNSLEHFSKSGQYATNEVMSRTLPRLNQTLYELNRTTAELHRLALDISNDPQRLLLGPQKPPPGPGEPGYKDSSP